MSIPSEKIPSVRYVQVDSERAGQRLDNLLLAELRGAPRSLIYRVLRTGQVRVNKGRAKAAYRVQEGDSVRIPPVRVPPRQEPGFVPQHQLEGLAQSILYEDKRLMVINKPAGLAVHGGSGISFGVIEGLRALRPEQKSLELVHRLDRDTSGCLLVSKRRSMLRWLHSLIRENAVEKRYLALLTGSWQKKAIQIDAPLRKNTLKSGERVVRVDPEGKASRTLFRRLRQVEGAVLVEARLHTGRTHQIRVHAAHLGTPIMGDGKYGDKSANARARDLGLKRLFLHASALSFELPDGAGRFSIEAPLPTELENVLTEVFSKHEI